MNRTKIAALAGVLTISSIFGMEGTRASAQAPNRAAYAAPAYSYGVFPFGYGYYPYAAAPRVGVVTPRAGVGHSMTPTPSNIGERYRDWSTGRTNLPLARPWLRPLQ